MTDVGGRRVRMWGLLVAVIGWYLVSGPMTAASHLSPRFDPPGYCFTVDVWGFAIRFSEPPNGGEDGAKDHCEENYCEDFCQANASDYSECSQVSRALDPWPVCEEAVETLAGPPWWTYLSDGTCSCTCEGGPCIPDQN